jgi:hypothetical protein
MSEMHTFSSVLYRETPSVSRGFPQKRDPLVILPAVPIA